MKKKLVFFIQLIIFVQLYASDTRFYSVNAIHGISMRETRSICKDESGFIWTSSKTGVLRISRENYRIYQLPITNLDIQTISLVYKNSTLFAYTHNGQLFIYDEIYDRFNLYVDIREKTKDDLLHVPQILIDDYNNCWIASSSGLYKYSDDEVSLVRACRGSTSIQRLVLKDDILFYSEGNQLNSVNVRTLRYENISDQVSSRNSQISKLYYDKRTERIWIGTTLSGLYYYDIKKRFVAKAVVDNLPELPILAIEQNSDSTLMIGLDGQGIWELDQKGKRVLNFYREDVDNLHSLKGDGIYDLFCDENNRVWVSTYTGGLSFFNQKRSFVKQIAHKVNNLNSLANNAVNKIMQDSKGDVWFATNNGISRWKLIADEWEHYFFDEHKQAKVFLTLCEDSNGNIWAGTYSSGAYVLEGKTGRVLKHYWDVSNSDVYFSKFVFDIFLDNDEDIWIGGNDGDILCYIAKEDKFKTYPLHNISKINELSPGNMLFASAYGLFQLNKESGGIEYLLTKYILQDFILDDGIIWASTKGMGLLKYDLSTDSLTVFTTEDGLPSNYVNSILLANDYLWLGTENGLCRFDLQTYNVLTHLADYSPLHFSINPNSAYKLENGDLIWGTNDGALMFDPNMFYQQYHRGRVFFQDISVLGRSLRDEEIFDLNEPIDKISKIKLKHNQNALSIDFLPMDITSRGSRYSWKLVGFDSEWSKPSNIKTITYTNIPSGNFELKIKMYDSSLSQIINERSLFIHVTSPFWASFWFRFLLLFGIVAIVCFALKLYINHLKQIHAEDKIRFFTNMAHDIRTSLTLVSAPIEELDKEKKLSTKGRYFLNLALDQSKRLSFVATQLLDFHKVDIGKGQMFLVMTDVVELLNGRKSMFEAAAKKQNITLEFSSNCTSYTSAVDILKMEKIIDNLLSNAIKYSHPGGKVEIDLKCHKNEWEFAVKDYGLGISEKAQAKLFGEFYREDNDVNSKIVGSGIGLLLVKIYVNMHQGKVSLTSKENKGSLFKVTIPYQEVEGVSESLLSDSDLLLDDEYESLIQEESAAKDDVVQRKRAHVFIVEDNIDLQMFLKYSLQDYYQISTFDDGEEAWKAVQKVMPDLIVSDVMMPNMDGFELCEHVKSKFETSHIPIILLTALSEQTDVLEGLGLGADDYITKPFDLSVLFLKIQSIIKNREIIKERVLNIIRQDNGDETPIISNELNDQFIKKAIEVVRENMANNEFRKDEFALEMHTSPSLLYKKIKSLTGQSPVDFIRTIRLDYAMELLQSGKYTVTEVSELSGFSTAGYFSTVFKRHFGKSPSQV